MIIGEVVTIIYKPKIIRRIQTKQIRITFHKTNICVCIFVCKLIRKIVMKNNTIEFQITNRLVPKFNVIIGWLIFNKTLRVLTCCEP